MMRPSLVALFLAASAPAALAAAQYTTFDVSGASGTAADGVNAKGTVVGTYWDRAYTYHGFIRAANGTITTFDAPEGATVMDARTLNRRGTAIGWYYLGGIYHGFLRTADGKIKTIDPDGSNDASPNAIGDDGIIVGAYSTSSSSYTHGFIRTADGTIATFDAPDGVSTVPLGINGSDVVTGLYQDSSGNSHGFIRAADGTIIEFDAPDAVYGTYAEAIDAAGDVSGTYWASNRVGYGFVRAADGTFTSFQIASKLTFPFVMNRKGGMTGYREGSDGIQHGFLRQPGGKMKRFDVPDSFSTAPASMNDKGVIAGAWWDGSYMSHGFLRTP
jgi:uncharacterized membrane protein